MQDLKEYLEARAAEVDAELDRLLPTKRQRPSTIHEAMRYSLFAGGKRLRPVLCLAAAEACGGEIEEALPPACAVELMHTYSLVHDDLPCMDDDDVRRGQPTVHKKWDEATAVLTGDALQTLAFELVSDPRSGFSGEVRAALALSLAQASGAAGMVLGQALDIAAETAHTPLGLDDITALQRGKTGALIEWSATAGARMAESDTSALSGYAHALGLAFQIADDILDVTGDSAIVGKAVGKDAEAGKATFVSLLGLESAQEKAAALIEDACDSLQPYGAKAEALQQAARFVVKRAH